MLAGMGGNNQTIGLLGSPTSHLLESSVASSPPPQGGREDRGGSGALYCPCATSNPWLGAGFPASEGDLSASILLGSLPPQADSNSSEHGLALGGADVTQGPGVRAILYASTRGSQQVGSPFTQSTRWVRTGWGTWGVSQVGGYVCGGRG